MRAKTAFKRSGIFLYAVPYAPWIDTVVARPRKKTSVFAMRIVTL